MAKFGSVRVQAFDEGLRQRLAAADRDARPVRMDESREREEADRRPLVLGSDLQLAPKP